MSTPNIPDKPDQTLEAFDETVLQRVYGVGSIESLNSDDDAEDYKAIRQAAQIYADAKVEIAKAQAKVSLLEYLLQGYPHVDLDGLTHDILEIAKADLAQLTKHKETKPIQMKPDRWRNNNGGNNN